MKDDLLAAIGALVDAVAVTTGKFRQSAADSEASVLTEVRQRLAEALDRLRDAQDGNDCLRAVIAESYAVISERDALIAQLRQDNAQLRQERARCDQSIVDLVKALNIANVNCASLRSQLARCGAEAQGYYFMAVLDDGSTAGPFSRS